MSMFSFLSNAAASILAFSVIVNASVNNGADLKILPLGASITWGQASSDGNGYRLKLRDLLEAQGHNVTYVGTVSHGSMSNNLCEGYPGSTISEVDAKAIASGAYNLDPDVVLLHLGTNDCAAQRQPIDDAPQRFATLLSHLKARSPNALILMSSLIHNKNPTIEACLTKLNPGLANVAKTAAAQGQNVQFVDMVDAVPWNALSADGTHPTDAGYAIMAQKWSESILSARLVTGGQKVQAQSLQSTMAPPSSTTSTMVTRVAGESSASLAQPFSAAAPMTPNRPTSSTAASTSVHLSSSARSTSSAAPQIPAAKSPSESIASQSRMTSLVTLSSGTSNTRIDVTSSKPSSSSSLTVFGIPTTSSSSIQTSAATDPSPISSGHTQTRSLVSYPSGFSTGMIAKTGLPSSQLPLTSARPTGAQPYTSGSNTIFDRRSAVWGVLIIVHLLFLAYIFGF
nr:multidomain esterase [Quercus suber]